MPGPIKTAHAHSSGTLVEVWRSIDFGDDQGEPWVTVCEHGSICEHRTRSLALSWSVAPEEWCEVGCRHAAFRRKRCPECGGTLSQTDKPAGYWLCLGKCGKEWPCPCYDCESAAK